MSNGDWARQPTLAKQKPEKRPPQAIEFYKVHVYCPKCQKRVGDGLSFDHIIAWDSGPSDIVAEMANRLCKHLQSCKYNSEEDWDKICDIAEHEVPCFWGFGGSEVHEVHAYEYLAMKRQQEGGGLRTRRRAARCSCGRGRRAPKAPHRRRRG